MKTKVVSMLSMFATWTIQFFIIWLIVVLFDLPLDKVFVWNHSLIFYFVVFILGVISYLVIIVPVENCLSAVSIDINSLRYYLGFSKISMCEFEVEENMVLSNRNHSNNTYSTKLPLALKIVKVITEINKAASAAFFLAFVYIYDKTKSEITLNLNPIVMEKFSLMLDQFWAYFDLATTMFSLAIVFMIIANALSFLRRGNETAQMLYAGMILIAAMFSAFGILLPDISHVLVSSSYLAFMLMCCSVCAAFFTAFTKKQSCYIAASVLFYASNILTCILMHC